MPSENNVSLKFSTLRRRCDPSDLAFSHDAERRWLSPSKARRLPALWWTTSIGGLVQISEGRFSWGVQRFLANRSWTRFSSPLLRRCFPSGLRLCPKPRHNSSNRPQPPPEESRYSYYVVVGLLFFRLWRECRHFWVLVETRARVHTLQIWSIDTCTLEEDTICSTVALSQRLAGPPFSSCNDAGVAVSYSCKGIGAATVGSFSYIYVPQPALNDRFTGQEVAMDGATPAVNLAKLVFRIDKGFVSCDGEGFITVSKVCGMAYRTSWFLRLATFGYYAAVIFQPWKAGSDKLSLISAKEIAHSMAIFYAKGEVNYAKEKRLTRTQWSLTPLIRLATHALSFPIYDHFFFQLIPFGSYEI